MWQIVDEQDEILHSGYINRFSKGPGQIYMRQVHSECVKYGQERVGSAIMFW